MMMGLLGVLDNLEDRISILVIDSHIAIQTINFAK
jgi:hypothetical protein